MKQNIKYSYCVDANNKLVHISSLSNATRHSCKWYCLQCGQEMVANMGSKKAWYFSHKADTACDGESYLHKLAKRRIKEKFDSSNSFPITFVRNIPCSRSEDCLFRNDSYCKTWEPTNIKIDLKYWNNKVLYDNCEEEVSVSNFRSDLLLTNTSKTAVEPVFIEIYKTHKSEDGKINSNYRIIETKKIKSEDDIEDIIENGFIEGQNCDLYNFKPNYPNHIGEFPLAERFVLLKRGSAFVIRANSQKLHCKDLHKKYIRGSAIELNIGTNNIVIVKSDIFQRKLNTIEVGQLYLTKKRGWNIKNCKLCDYYKLVQTSTNYYKYCCTLYKVNNIGHKVPIKNDANKCQRYELNQELKSIPLSELEKFIEIVPNN